jgi:hypothetical protein
VRPVSAGFLSSLRGSHTMAARARVVPAGSAGTNPTGTAIPILAGDVRYDADAAVRATLDLTTGETVGDATGVTWPRHADDLLAPYGNEIYVERGVQVTGGSVEWVGQGYFRIEGPDQNDAPNGPIRISAKDRMAGLIDARFLEPRQYTASQTYGEVFDELVNEVYPAATIEWDDGTDSTTLDRLVTEDQDRHGLLAEMVKARGKIWHWDHRGVLVIRDPPPVSAPVWEVNAGTGGVLVSLGRQLTREGVYNAVVASGEAADSENPVRGVAIDNNPESPTYFYGPFGPVPRFFTSPLLVNSVQAAEAAATLLRSQLGLPYRVDFTAIANPALEPWDPVLVRPGGSDGAETHVIKTLTVPLTAAVAMTADTREQGAILIGGGT